MSPGCHCVSQLDRARSHARTALIALAALTALARCAARPAPTAPTLPPPVASAPAPAPIAAPIYDPPAAPPLPPPPPPPSPFVELPDWNSDTISAVLPAWQRTCERLLRASGDRPVGRGTVIGTAADWQPACRALPPSTADDATVRAYFEQWFVPVRVDPEGHEQGLFTGYYEPELHGSRTRRGRYTVPLYGPPADLGHRHPYYTRAQIASGALHHETPLLWVDDRVDAFFLEIQGSGRVVFEDGTSTFLNYAGSNGHPYVAIGRVLIDHGEIDRSAVSLQSIRAWLLAHPSEAQGVMNHNPSYVFFRESAGGGSHGAEGVTLTPGRSLAVDLRFIPLGVPLYLDVAALEGVGPIRRLVVAQDTGGAIRGPVRGDLFWGAGAAAYDRAGRMRQHGRYWLLVPRTLPPPVIPHPEG